jgi:UDP-N-acetylglucosamine 2-epimerase (non-hydrolysing)
MKVKPVIDALEAAQHETVLVHTGQHYDPIMSDIFFEELELKTPEFHLGVGSGSHAVQTAKTMVAFEALIAEVKPDVTIVVGDVNATLACALVSAKANVPVAHVEAGLRSRDWAMPEEVNRVVTDRLSDLLFAPSADAVVNLRGEGYRDDQVHLVGNVMIDTLLANVDRARSRDVAPSVGLRGEYGIVTMHRPSNVDNGASLEDLVEVFDQIAADIPLILPAHPRVAANLRAFAPRHLRIVEPFGYLDFLGLMANASIVLTDSGGIQEETTALGVPCLTIRESTERPVTVTEGTNRVVGVDPHDIYVAAKETLRDPPVPRCPALWDGRAAERIAQVFESGLPERRPTELS